MNSAYTLPVGFSARDAADIGRMLRAWRGGQFTPPPSTRSRSGFEGDGLTIKITGPAGGGKYYAKIMQGGETDVSESGDLTEDDFGKEYTPDDSDMKVLALNATEKGKSTNALESGTVCRASFHRQNENGMIVVVIESIAFYDCT